MMKSNQLKNFLGSLLKVNEVRYENIKTQSDGFYRKINLDAAGNTIFNERFDETLNEVSSIIQSRRLKIEAQMVNLANLLANLAKD